MSLGWKCTYIFFHFFYLVTFTWGWKLPISPHTQIMWKFPYSRNFCPRANTFITLSSSGAGSSYMLWLQRFQVSLITNSNVSRFWKCGIFLNWNEPDLKGNETTVYDFHLGFLNFLHDSCFSQRSLDTRCLVEVIASFPSNWLNTADLLNVRTVSVLDLFFQTSLTNFNLLLGVPVFLRLVVSTVLSS